MKFIPRHGQIFGRVLIKRVESKIIRPDQTKQSKFFLVDAVGPEATKLGINVGDVLMVKTMINVKLDGTFRPLADERDALAFVRGVSLDRFLVQTEDGENYVPFGDPYAAPSLGGEEDTAKAAE